MAEHRLCRPERAARPDAASSVAPIATAIGAPCVLASERGITVRATNDVPPIPPRLTSVRLTTDAELRRRLEERASITSGGTIVSLAILLVVLIAAAAYAAWGLAHVLAA